MVKNIPVGKRSSRKMLNSNFICNLKKIPLFEMFSSTFPGPEINFKNFQVFQVFQGA